MEKEAPTSIAWGQRTNSGSTAIEEIPCVGFGRDAFYAPVMVDDRWKAYHGCKGYLDPAGRGKDEMAWANVGQLYGYLFVKTVAGVRGGATQQNLERIVTSLRDDDVRDLYVETNFGGDMLIQLIEPVIRRFACKAARQDQPAENPAFPKGWACSVTGCHSTGQKELRIISSLEPVMNQHRLVVDPSVASDTILMRQMTRLTSDRNCLENDDRIEALGACVNEWREYLHQDADSMSERQSEKAHDETVRRYRLHNKAPNPRWFMH